MTSWLRTVLLLVLAAGPAAAQTAAPTADAPSAAQAPALQMPYTQFTLPNGLHVILHEDHRCRSCAVNVWYHVGSARERPGRTGFAHLFEHLMFMGSGHVQAGRVRHAARGGRRQQQRLDRLRTAPTTGSTSRRTPSSSRCILESDRMGYLLDAMTPATVDAQRDVVKNERRQSYENRPYGMAEIALSEMLYPEGHPVSRGRPSATCRISRRRATTTSWQFFKKYYAPNNASLVVAGDIDPARARRSSRSGSATCRRDRRSSRWPPPAASLTKVERQDADRPRPARRASTWRGSRRRTSRRATRRSTWSSAVLAGGKNSRLYKRLVYDMQIAQRRHGRSRRRRRSARRSRSSRPPGPGHTARRAAGRSSTRRSRSCSATPPDAREVERAVNQIEAELLRVRWSASAASAASPTS